MTKDISWDDYKIAYQVALDGSLSKAGQSLGINHATVLRRINQLEEKLELTLFLRHQRGYQLTDAGCMLLDEFPQLQSGFTQLENRLRNIENQLSGELRITTVNSFSAKLTSLLSGFYESFPRVRLKIIVTDKIIALESGEAHISLRAGPKPTMPDLIAKSLYQVKNQYFASQRYVDTYGVPKNISEFNQHQWVLPSQDKHHIPFVEYIVKQINPCQVVFQSNQFTDVQLAVKLGMGIGPLNENDVADELIPIDIDLPPQNDTIWFTYHKELKNSSRIKTCFDYLKNALSQ